MVEKNKKMVVFGIDGATDNIMRPLLQKGDLPHLASLMTDGVEAKLISTIPFVTPTAFTSFMTGVNPGKHGIFDFTSNTHGSYDMGPIVNYSHIRVKTLWDLLTRQGKRMNVVTVPFTYPPPPLNGAMLCLGNMTEGRLCTYPPELGQEILDNIGGYEERYCKVMREPGVAPSEELLDEFVDLCNYQAEKVKQATLYLLKTNPWDFLMIVFVITDRFQHYFWRHMDPDHPAYDSNSSTGRKNLVADSYRKVDDAIGEIMKLVSEEAHLMVMSDHGFGPLNNMFYTNRWLEKEGLLHFHKKRTRWARSTPSIKRCMEKVGLSIFARQLPESIGETRIPVMVKSPKPLLEAIDWTKTQAYATRWGLNINLKSREPFGIVSPGAAYETLIRNIMKSLREIKHPKTGLPLFDQVVRKEEIYHGPYMHEAHDILIDSGSTVLRKDTGYPDILRGITASDLGNGDHRKEGILIIKGQLIEPTAKLDNPKLEDLLPTILYLMGLPVPGYMDGRVLTSCIKEDVLKRHHVVSDSSVSINRDGSFSDNPSEGMMSNREDDERIREQLKNLGYI